MIDVTKGHGSNLVIFEENSVAVVSVSSVHFVSEALSPPHCTTEEFRFYSLLLIFNYLLRVSSMSVSFTSFPIHGLPDPSPPVLNPLQPHSFSNS